MSYQNLFKYLHHIAMAPDQHFKPIVRYIYIFLVLPVYCYQPIYLHPPHTCVLSHVTPWTAARQAPLSMEFFRQEYWSGLPFPTPSTPPRSYF